MKRCPYCKKELSDTAIKCRYCKQRVSGIEKYGDIVVSRRRFKWTFLALLIIAILGGAIYLKVGPRGEYYINNTYRLRIWHPKEWKVFDISSYYYIYKGLSSAIIQEDSDIRLVCGFSCSKNLKKLDPLITVALQPIADDARGLTAEGLAKSIEKSLKLSALSEHRSIKERPTVCTVHGRKFVKYTATSTSQGAEWKNLYYCFLKDTKLYIICLSAKADTLDMYKKVFDDIAGSIKVHT